MPDNIINSLDDESIDILQEIINEYKAGRLGGSKTFPPPKVGKEDGQVYVAKVPAGGIPAMVDDVLGEAECELFKLQISGTDRILAPLLYPNGAPSTNKVYNPFDFIIPSGYHIIARSSSGPWIIAQGGGMVLYHGIITRNCGGPCNAYEVQLVNRFLLAGCDDCGSGSGSGSGSG